MQKIPLPFFSYLKMFAFIIELCIIEKKISKISIGHVRIFRFFFGILKYTKKGVENPFYCWAESLFFCVLKLYNYVKGKQKKDEKLWPEKGKGILQSYWLINYYYDPLLDHPLPDSLDILRCVGFSFLILLNNFFVCFFCANIYETIFVIFVWLWSSNIE